MKTAKEKTYKIQSDVSTLTGMDIHYKNIKYSDIDSLTRRVVDHKVWEINKTIMRVLRLPLSVDITSNEQESQ